MQAPDRLEHFDILRRDDGTPWELGRGAMGVTYKARDARLHSDVALKVIHPLLNTSKEVHDRFLREARAAAALRHPNIASAMHLGETPDGGCFYVMEFCDGPTLQEAVAATGPFPSSKAIEMTTQIARALLAAEAKGIIHRDLKPANLILTERTGEGLVTKVIDFGLARALDAGGAAAVSLATQGTGFLGTVQFASPEQLEERPVDIRSDFYSLGACLWYALTGHPVFRGPLARVMAQTLNAEPDWSLLKDTPPQVIALLKRLLAKSPDARPPNGAALLSECLACLQSLSHPPASHSPAQVDEILKQQVLSAGEPASHLSDGETLLGRYRVQGAPAKHLLGTEAALTDIEAIDEPSLRGLFVDATVLSAPPVLKRLQTLITGLHEHPHPALPAIVTWAEFGADWLVVMERAEGCPLLDVLKARSALPLREALDWLLPVAEAMDHMQEHGLGMLEAGLGGITIHFEDAVRDAKALLSQPREKWPRHRVIADAFAWEQSADGPHTPSTMPTVAARQIHARGENPPAPGTPAALIAALVMELAGGKPPQSGRYTPLPRLSEDANAQLRNSWLSGTANCGAAKLIRQLKQGLAIEDDLQVVEKAPKPLQAVAKPEKTKKPVKLPAPETAPKPSEKRTPHKKALSWLPHALAACLIVAGVIYAMTAGGAKPDVTSPEPPPRTELPPPDDSKPKIAETEEKAAEPPPPDPMPMPVPVAQAPVAEAASKPDDDIPPYARGISNADEIVTAGPTPAVTHAAPVMELAIDTGQAASAPQETTERKDTSIVPATKRGQEVAELVRTLQQLENQREIDIIMSHYAPVVDYYKDGRISNDEVRQRKLAYYERWPRAESTVSNLFVRATNGDDVFEASYTSDFLHHKREGGWMKGQSIQTVEIAYRDNLPIVIRESNQPLGQSVPGKPGEAPPVIQTVREPRKDTKNSAGGGPAKSNGKGGGSFREKARATDDL